jgi:hypothetical protein
MATAAGRGREALFRNNGAAMAGLVILCRSFWR